MDVKVGDRIAVETEHVGEPERRGEVLEVIQGDTAIRYRVKWHDGHESVFTPAAGVVRVLESG
ncbi:MAG TPA: DUF1918 domain-containing protein [Actinomycetota bacterium]|jgi:hypothetical protein